MDNTPAQKGAPRQGEMRKAAVSLPEEWCVHAIRGKGLQLGLIVQESWTSFKKLEGKAIREKWNMVGTSA